MPEEIKWKEVPGLPGYKISDHGTVIGKRGKFMKLGLNTKGYPQLRIPPFYCQKIHRIVAELFLSADDRSLQVNHIDGNKMNNHVSNLEYVTCRQNIHHSIRTGLRSATQNLKSKAMFDPTQLLIIRDCFTAWYGNKEIAVYFKCSDTTISKIRVGKHYPINKAAR